MLFRKRKLRNVDTLDPDEVFLDSGNLPDFDTGQFEGVIERPITDKVILLLGGVFFLIIAIFLVRIFILQVIAVDRYEALASNNRLEHSTIFTERGVIYDRNGIELAWNNPERTYSDIRGLGHVLGYVSYPTADELEVGDVHPKEFVGRDGVESYFNGTLQGATGIKILEVDVLGEVQSESVLRQPEDGRSVNLSIDSEVQEKLYTSIKDLSIDRGFVGGSGLIMDIETGELLAATNYPEYSPNVLARGNDPDTLVSYQSDERKPFLNRAFQGLYTPGSIFKPFVALAALNEGLVNPEKVFHTTGQLEIVNPYDETKSTIFRDWKNHGAVNMEDAIAVSSNVYFFSIGGGFGDQEGVGISRIEKYSRLFGVSVRSGSGVGYEGEGVIPNPEWKQETFGEPWRLGDTYNTSIGQYSLQVTPIQMVRAISAIANNGKLLKPSFIKGGDKRTTKNIEINQSAFEVVQDGMRAAVSRGTASGLDIYGLEVSAKTGTAEIDFGKKKVNSWVVGYFPAEEPRYAFTVVMESGPRDNFIGGVFVMRQLLDWMVQNTPEYIK